MQMELFFIPILLELLLYTGACKQKEIHSQVNAGLMVSLVHVLTICVFKLGYEATRLGCKV